MDVAASRPTPPFRYQFCYAVLTVPVPEYDYAPRTTIQVQPLHHTKKFRVNEIRYYRLAHSSMHVTSASKLSATAIHQRKEIVGSEEPTPDQKPRLNDDS